MKKLLLAAVAVGSFLFMGVGAALANPITDYGTFPAALPYNILDGAPITYSHDIRDNGYNGSPYDILTSASLSIVFYDTDNGTNKFDIDLDTGQLDAINSNFTVPTTFTYDAFGTTGNLPNLKAAILANPDGYFEVTITPDGKDIGLTSSQFTAAWDVVSTPPGIPPNGAVPEPATMFLLGTGLVGVAGAARRKKKNQA